MFIDDINEQREFIPKSYWMLLQFFGITHHSCISFLLLLYFAFICIHVLRIKL